MTQARMLRPPSRDLPRHTWQPPKFWMWFPDFQDARDKRVMQYRLTLEWKWKTLQSYWDYQNQSAQPSGFVHQDPAVQNRGMKFKTSWCRLKEIFRTPIGRIVVWTTIRKGLDRKLLGKGSKLRLSIRAPRKGFCFSLSLWTQKKWEDSNNLKPMWAKLMKKWDLDEPTPLSDQVFLGVRSVNASRMWKSREKTKICANLQFQQVLSNNYLARKDAMRKPLFGPTTWKDMWRNTWKDTAKWHTKRAVVQSLHTLFRWSPLLKWRIGNSWTVVKSLFTSRPEVFLVARLDRPDT